VLINVRNGVAEGRTVAIGFVQFLSEVETSSAVASLNPASTQRGGNKRISMLQTGAKPLAQTVAIWVKSSTL